MYQTYFMLKCLHDNKILKKIMTTLRCPNCQKPTTWQDNFYRPFCSERCKLIDFGEWANQNYKITGNLSDDTPFASQDLHSDE